MLFQVNSLKTNVLEILRMIFIWKTKGKENHKAIKVVGDRWKPSIFFYGNKFNKGDHFTSDWSFKRVVSVLLV